MGQIQPSWETLDVGGRRSGNTTRFIDFAIQDLFNQGYCVASDHHDRGEHREANRFLLRKIINRLKLEHGGIEFDVVDGIIPQIKLKNS